MIQLINSFLKAKFLPALLAINCFFLISCKPSRVETSTGELASILNNEINQIHRTDIILVKENFDNEFLRSFLEEFDTSFQPNSTKDEEIKDVLTTNEIAHLIKQLQGEKLPLQNYLKGHDRIKFLKTETKGEIHKDGLQVAQEYTQTRIIFSLPVISSTKDYALIYISIGVEDSMSSSIHVYKKMSGEWKFYTQIYDAIE